ncbi:MAG TPA: thioredoxin domain-containing protein [Syntrophorhabdales bacterium]|nr:thioredoxin domain-containing protein [Syntrophorhabdales bacterium]
MAESRQENGRKYNRLIEEKSPYLLQHATNPVDWYSWSDEAFERARKEEKPIFLSIGYSTCHWCHVMERESFEDQEAAKLLNDTFVAIKVDREERPDIDAIYMGVCQMLTGSGGWPLTIMMTPDRKPFFAATYIPRQGRAGRPGLVELIPQVAHLWKTKRTELLSSSEQIAARLRETTSIESGTMLGEHVLRSAYESLVQHFDQRYGGFGSAPKFPSPHNFLFLLRYARRTGERQAVEMVERTLQAMRLGGIYDHVGFGFHRYSTDQMWTVPHFEKMLYDQATLALAYTEAYQLTTKVEYAKTAREILTYVLRDMRSEEGGFFSAEDADSEGEEGKFYLWTESELEEVLGREDAGLIAKVYNTQLAGNFSEEASGRRGGGNILYLKQPLHELAAFFGLTPNELEARVERARTKLFEARRTRIHPLKDDKVLTDWNGLMIAALAKGAQALTEPAYGDAAVKAADFILERMRGKDGRLLHRFREGEASIQGNLDDYAFVIWGLLELYELTFEAIYLQHASGLTADLITHFWDTEQGGFFFTPDDGEALLMRKKEIYDGAIPSGNSASMLNLLRLGRLTGRADLEEKGAQIARLFSRKVELFPAAFTQLLVGLDFSIGPSHELVIVGKREADDTNLFVQTLRARFIPNKVVLLKPVDEQAREIVRLAPYAEPYTALRGRATAYVCSNYSCQLPTTDPGEMLRLLGEQER